MRGRLAQPALDGEDDGRPADHFVAGEDLLFGTSETGMYARWVGNYGEVRGHVLIE